MGYSPRGHLQTFPIKINQNPKLREFHCKGLGLQPRITFTPNSVDCGPILPTFEGQAPNEVRIRMANPCGFPVEVMCLDLDKQYMMDEEVLRTVDADGRYNEAGVMYRLPLAPGQQIWPDLSEEAQRRKQAAADAAAVTAAGADTSSTLDAAAADPAAAPADSGEVGDLDAVVVAAPSATAAAAKLVVVLHGPVMVGSTTQALLLSERYGAPVTTFDDLLFEGADIEAPASAPEPASSDPAAAETAAAEAPPPHFDAEISDLLYSKVLIDPDLEAQPGFVPPASKLTEVELCELLVRGLKQALQSTGSSSGRYARGLVLDGLRSKYCGPGVAARLLMEALGMQAVLPEAVAAAPPKAAAKGKAAEAPPPPPLADGWNGPHDVFFLTFDATADLVRERVRAKKARDEAAAAAAAAIATADTASDGVEEGITGGEPAHPEADVAEGLSDEERTAKAAEKAAVAAEAARLTAEAAEAELTREVDALLSASVAEAAAVSVQLGKAGFPGNRAVRRAFDPAGPPERVFLAACGITFNLGQVSVALPRLESDGMLIPDPYIMQVSQEGWSKGGEEEVHYRGGGNHMP